MIKLEELPYKKNALEPFISEETLNFHYGKHHKSYVDNLNKLIKSTDFENMGLEEIIKKSNGAIFNNSAQIYNHTFYWNCLAKNSGGEPYEKIEELIDRDFGSFETFKEEFGNKAIGNFGSGWTWLVFNVEKKLEIVNTSNAETILTSENKPLLVIDVWEHAYYIDVRNARPAYIKNFWNLVNWDFVNNNLK